jgi:hypothetical protein
MSVLELAERFLKEAKSGFVLDWKKKRDEICTEHRCATTTTDRVACLALYKIVMNAVEKSGICGDVETFKRMHLQEYRLLLMQEAAVRSPDDMIDPHILAEITHREVREGRMDPSDSLHRMMTETNGTEAEEQRGKLVGTLPLRLNRWREEKLGRVKELTQLLRPR